MPQSLLPAMEFDVAIIGAGPVGLTLAIELSRLELAVLVIDRRPPPELDPRLRPQLLVAREGDLANLDALGVDIREPQIVSLLATRCEGDLVSGRSVTGQVRVIRNTPERATDIAALAAQPPVALVPIGRLQQALLERALQHGARVVYDCDVERVRRHARFASLTCTDGSSTRAALVIIATGAARSLATTLLRGHCQVELPARKMIAGVFAMGGPLARWIRVELPVAGFAQPARATLLQTPEETDTGTALLVDTQVETPTEEQLHHGFEAAARVQGLAGVPFTVPPMVFETAVTAMARRTITGDGRAPVIVAGDAAQTGHVFTGQTCFINIALALQLASELRHARLALVDRKITNARLLMALARYETQSQIGASILARTSRRHYEAHHSGAWALAGIANAGWARRAIRLGGPVVLWRAAIDEVRVLAIAGSATHERARTQMLRATSRARRLRARDCRTARGSRLPPRTRRVPSDRSPRACR